MWLCLERYEQDYWNVIGMNVTSSAYYNLEEQNKKLKIENEQLRKLIRSDSDVVSELFDKAYNNEQKYKELTKNLTKFISLLEFSTGSNLSRLWTITQLTKILGDTSSKEESK